MHILSLCYISLHFTRLLTTSAVFAAAPIFTIPIVNAFVDVGQTAEFRCYATGVPDVRYKWYRNATALNSSMLAPADRDRYTFAGDGNILIIANVHQPDAGMYQCEASNTHGTKLCSAELRVLGMLRLLGLATLYSC